MTRQHFASERPEPYFDRPRVIALLRESTEQYGITFVSAPLSYGKTVAATAFIRQFGGTLHSFSDGELPDSTLRKWESAPQSLLILDDFDDLDIPRQNKLVDFLLENRLHALIFSRSNVPLRLLSATRCHTIGAQELGFTREELLAYGKLHFPTIAPRQLEQVAHLANGWISAFEIGLSVLQRGSTRTESELMEQCYVEIRRIYDEKLMAPMAPPEWEFLLAIGCFESISVEMAGLVTGLADCQSIFDALNAKFGCFIEKSDGVYCLHESIRRYLTARRATRLSAEERIRIFRSAGRYYRLRDQLSESISCYEQAEDYQILVPMLEEIALQSPENGALWSLREHFRIVPEYLTEQSPTLCFARSILDILSFHPDDARRWRDRVEMLATAVPAGDPRKRKAQALLLYLSLAIPQPNGMDPSLLQQAAQQIRREHRMLPPLTLTLNRPSLLSGTVDLSPYIGQDNVLPPAVAAAADALGGTQSAGILALMRAEILYQHNALPQALLDTVGALAQIEQGGSPSLLLAAVFIQSSVMMIEGQSESVASMLDNLGRKLQKSDSADLMPNYRAICIGFALYDGIHRDIDRWLEDTAPDENGDFCTLDRFAYFVKLRVYLSRDQLLPFLALAQRLHQLCVAYGRTLELIELDALTAIAQEQLGQHSQALALLENALQAARPHGYVRVLGNLGRPLYQLLQCYARQKPKAVTDFVVEVTEAAKQMALRFPNYLRPKRADVPTLTGAECNVLRLMAQEYTNREIADFLSVTTNTVKFHSKNLFFKLGTGNRAQTVKAARELGLIE